MRKKYAGSGAKDYQRSDYEDRAQEYRLWHRQLDRRLIMLDVDAIEWRMKDGILRPVGVFEITRVDTNKSVDKRYLDAIIQRFFQRDLQGQVANEIARKLNTQAYITLFRQSCTEFWVYPMSESTCGQWKHYKTPQEYENFLLSLE